MGLLGHIAGLTLNLYLMIFSFCAKITVCFLIQSINMKYLDLGKQYQRIKTPLDERLANVFENCSFIKGPEVQELEQQLADYVGVADCIGVANGTDALQIALMALDLKPDDEVIIPAFSFFATAEVVMLVGCKLVMVDVDDYFNINCDQLAEVITPKTKAIIPVGMFGQCAEMKRVNAIAAQHDLAVIEDAAQSFGATYYGKRSCGLTTIGCTSFFPAKPLGCYGDGGAIFTNDKTLATRCRQIADHGQDRRYHHSLIGLNSRLDTIQAAVLLEKLTIFSDELDTKKQLADEYTKQLVDVVKTPEMMDSNTSAYAQYTILTDQRDQLANYLAEQGIPTSIHYPVPLHQQPAVINYGYQSADLSNAEKLAGQVLSLPFSAYLAKEDQETVVTHIKRFFKTVNQAGEQ